MKPKVYILIASLNLVSNCFSQAPLWQWAKGAGGNLTDQSVCIAVDKTGNSFIAGNYSSVSAHFDSVTLINSWVGFDDIFLAKYNSFGNLIWAKRVTGNNNDYCTSIAVDLNGNLFMTGYFYSNSISFGSITLLKTGAVPNIFIAKFDNSGNTIWAKSV